MIRRLDRYDFEKGNFSGLMNALNEPGKMLLTKIDAALSVRQYVIGRNYDVIDPNLKVNLFRETGLEKTMAEIVLNHLKRYSLSENPRVSGVGS